MGNSIDILTGVIGSSWGVLLDSAFFVLFGFFISGLLKAFLPDDLIRRHLGGNRLSAVIKASLAGIPIPLCSCGVLPTAAGLKEQGAGNGAVTSFMISTPETGVDSIAITYALLDPLMTVLRPVTAFFSAILTGVAVHFWGTEEKAALKMADGSCDCGCGCRTVERAARSKLQRFRDGMRFAFDDLLNDIGPWLILGVVLAGLIGVFISPGMIEGYLGGGLFSMLAMLVVATPMYVCATASTPIAAALVLKGLSPGAALVFLLAGPATNVATMTVVSRLLGKRTALIYVGSILLSSLLCGLAVNRVYDWSGLSIKAWHATTGVESHGIVAYLSTVVLLLLISRGFWRKVFRRPNLIQLG